MVMRVVGWIWDGHRTRFSRPLTADWIAVDGEKRCCFSFAFPRKKELMDR